MVSKAVLRIVLWVRELEALHHLFALTYCKPRLYFCGLLQRPKLTPCLAQKHEFLFMITIRNYIKLVFCSRYCVLSNDVITGKHVIHSPEVVYVWLICNSEQLNSNSSSVEFVSRHFASPCSFFLYILLLWVIILSHCCILQISTLIVSYRGKETINAHLLIC